MKGKPPKVTKSSASEALEDVQPTSGKKVIAMLAVEGINPSCPSYNHAYNLLGPPVVPFLTVFWGEGSPTKIDKTNKQKKVGTSLF